MAEDEGREDPGKSEADADLPAGASDPSDISDPQAPPVLQYFGPTIKRTDPSAEIAGRRSGDPLHLVTLITVDIMEAQLACAKLEAEGIPAFVIDQHASVVHPLLFRNAQLQVAERDLVRAKEILDRPAAVDPEDHDEDAGYVEENFRCPRCHRKAVELMPLARSAMAARAGCLVVLLLPAVPTFIGWMAMDASAKSLSLVFHEWQWLWILILAACVLAILLQRRRKRCERCGHVW